jgi:hypothetical protein
LLRVQRRTVRAAGRRRPVRPRWWGWSSIRRVALAEPSLPYAKLNRPVGAKSRVPVERGGEDRDRAYGDAIACVMVGVHSVIELPNRGWLEALADGGRGIHPVEFESALRVVM